MIDGTGQDGNAIDFFEEARADAFELGYAAGKQEGRSIESERDKLRDLLSELAAAMHKYEWDVEGEQPIKHRDMMRRVDAALATKVKSV